MQIANFIPSSALRLVGRTSLKLKKHAPEILTGVGIVGSVVSGALFVRAGMKTSDLVERVREDIDTVHSIHEDDLKRGVKTRAYNQDLATVYVQAGKSFAKVYGPPVTLGVASIISVAGGHGILKKRNVAIAAAYKAVESSFADYRARVAEEFGEDRELDIAKGVREETVVDEKGKKKKVLTQIESGHSPYAKCFDQLSSQWEQIPEYNLTFLRAQEAHFNNKLYAKGHVFLNEVYDALDIPRTKAGNIVGWLANDELGDGHISFGLYDLNSESARRFVNGYEDAIWLDFNVDGPILEMI